MTYEEVNNNKTKSCVRVNAKAAVLEGKTHCSNIVVSCFYDTKPVKCIPTYTESITWVEKELCFIQIKIKTCTDQVLALQ